MLIICSAHLLVFDNVHVIELLFICMCQALTAQTNQDYKWDYKLPIILKTFDFIGTARWLKDWLKTAPTRFYHWPFRTNFSGSDIKYEIWMICNKSLRWMYKCSMEDSYIYFLKDNHKIDLSNLLKTCFFLKLWFNSCLVITDYRLHPAQSSEPAGGTRKYLFQTFVLSLSTSGAQSAKKLALRWEISTNLHLAGSYK